MSDLEKELKPPNARGKLLVLLDELLLWVASIIQVSAGENQNITGKKTFLEQTTS